VPAKPNPMKLYLTAGQLRTRYGGRSDMWLDRIMKRDSAFPRPISIGRYRYWDLAAIEAYERDIAAKRDTRGTQRHDAPSNKQAAHDGLQQR
jgi:predicted DNA-binding transcriptional regulator AlpA